ncbi:MAG: rhomboid family intramembrane serine protease [Candidatus Woesearchaeota archaeon]
MRYVALWIALVILVVFGLQQYYGTEPFVLDQRIMFEEPYRIITSIFAHSTISHLMGNLFSLLLFGLILEGRIGPKNTLMIFILSGIGINLLLPVMPYTRVLGASGAIFAIMGTLIVLRPMMTIFMGFVPMPMIIAGIIWVVQDLLGILYPTNIANIAHLIGLLLGVIAGLYLRTTGLGDRIAMLNDKHKDDSIDRELDDYERRTGLR